MAYNKVIYGGNTLIDLTSDTITADKLAQGYTAHDRTGTVITGTMDSSSILIEDTTDEHGGTIRTITGKVVQLQTKTITPTNQTQVVDPDEGYDGFSQITVNAGGSTINNQDKSVTPSESQQSVTADSGYTGLGTVTVGAISSTYVGSGIARKSSSDLTASGATVTAPAGYYASNATKTVSSGSATGPSSLSGSSATVSTGTNTLTLTKTGVTTTPTVTAGYVSSATASTATVSLTASVTTKAAATITPGTTNQTIASGTYLTGTQTIAGDADLVASNIVSGVQIFGVTGNVVLQNYYTGSSAPSSSLGSNGDLYLQS